MAIRLPSSLAMIVLTGVGRPVTRFAVSFRENRTAQAKSSELDVRLWQILLI